MTQQINWEQFEATYKPVINHLDDNASFGGLMFETYGDEFETVQNAYKNNPDTVWTVIADTGNVDVTSGFHLVNRLGYIITEVPAVGFIDVINEDYEPCIEEKREAVLDDMLDTCLTDRGYLKSLLQNMINKKSEEEINKMYDDAFGDLN